MFFLSFLYETVSFSRITGWDTGYRLSPSGTKRGSGRRTPLRSCLPFDDGGGATLREIYDNVRSALSGSYYVEQKRSVLRLKGKNDADYLQDFHIDVVPGRFSDGSRSDCFIYQAESEKCRLKTNIDVHIKHIRDSGLTPIVRVMKLWNVQKGIGVKTFVMELLVVDALSGKKDASLGDQFRELLALLRDDVWSIHIEDPANPTGNDLSSALDDARLQLSAVAASTLSHIDDGNFGSLFGDVEPVAASSIPLVSVVSSVDEGSRPWSR